MGYESKQRELARARWISTGFSALLILGSLAWLAYTVVQVDKLNADVEQKEADVDKKHQFLGTLVRYMAYISKDDLFYYNAPDSVQEAFLEVYPELDVDTSKTITRDTADPRWKNVVVQYFPKDDKAMVEAALKELPVEVITGFGNPSLNTVPTNAVWFGGDVHPDIAKDVTIALVEAGLDIQVLRRGSTKFRANLIQIGTLARELGAVPFTVPAVGKMEF